MNVINSVLNKTKKVLDKLFKGGFISKTKQHYHTKNKRKHTYKRKHAYKRK